MLSVSGVTVRYDKHNALSDVAVNVDQREIVVILGANGAGKTTLLKTIAGFVRPMPGAAAVFDGQNLLSLLPHRVVKLGIALVPEGRGIFGQLTVRENLQLGAFIQRGKQVESHTRSFVLDLFPRLQQRSSQLVQTMSGGEQQMVAIGRALMSAPKLLLLDEPSLGLSPIMCTELFRALARIRDQGVGILLVEQNARQSLKIADRGYLMESGRIVGQDSSAALRDDPAVRTAYLGATEAASTLPHR